MLRALEGEAPITLGEGFTPFVHARSLSAKYGLDRLYIKDESLNPTNWFKARGQSAAITRAKYLGVETVSVPSAGNAMAAYAARAWLHAKVFLPKDVKVPFVRECRLYGADIENLTDFRFCTIRQIRTKALVETRIEHADVRPRSTSSDQSILLSAAA
jgi:threonine synthase